MQSVFVSFTARALFEQFQTRQPGVRDVTPIRRPDTVLAAVIRCDALSAATGHIHTPHIFIADGVVNEGNRLRVVRREANPDVAIGHADCA
jgi:hypothetical protein